MVLLLLLTTIIQVSISPPSGKHLVIVLTLCTGDSFMQSLSTPIYSYHSIVLVTLRESIVVSTMYRYLEYCLGVVEGRGMVTSWWYVDMHRMRSSRVPSCTPYSGTS